MFTGIIEAVGKVRQMKKSQMWLDVPFADELKQGQSVACDGVCLTVVEIDSLGFRVDFLEDTKRLTCIGSYQVGSLVNVERAMRVNDRFDGHIVQAHVEGLGELICTQSLIAQDAGKSWLLSVSVPPELLKYMIHKGIIIFNGIALTIVLKDNLKSQIQVEIIPHTWENTNLNALEIGSSVNVETDVLAKYVEGMLESSGFRV